MGGDGWGQLGRGEPAVPVKEAVKSGVTVLAELVPGDGPLPSLLQTLALSLPSDSRTEVESSVLLF